MAVHVPDGMKPIVTDADWRELWEAAFERACKDVDWSIPDDLRQKPPQPLAD